MKINTAYQYFAFLSTTLTANGEKYLRSAKPTDNGNINHILSPLNNTSDARELLNIFDSSQQRVVEYVSSQQLAEMADIVPANTLTNQILCGYQGWYAFPGDGAPINRWKHWFKNQPANINNHPDHTEAMMDMLPTEDEYDEEDMNESTGLVNADGSHPKLFSNVRPRVVLKHFEWMKTYGIHGVMHMRFMESIHLANNRKWKTMVLRNVKAAAETTGRVFAVSYNIAGKTLDCNALHDLKADWKRLVDEEKITQSDRYIHHNGRPVLRIYGIGFTTVPASDCPVMMQNLIRWFQGYPDSGGNVAPTKYQAYVVGGVPSHWNELSGDSRTPAVWKDVYESLDAIHPWLVGRWRTISGFDNYNNNVISRDAAYCASKGILYMPTMWPGFSWHNLKDGNHPVNDIPRLGGDFMWKQAYKMISNTNIQTIWMAQFDEMDEGTAIMKVKAKSSDLPIEGNWLALDTDGHNLPSDWYLRLAGESQRMLNGQRALTNVIPLDPSDPPPATPNPTAPPTAKPTTTSPTTSSPTTPKPSTPKPTTDKPTTATPTTSNPTVSPSQRPTTASPTNSPSQSPVTPSPTTFDPTVSPSKEPTAAPSDTPSASPQTDTPTNPELTPVPSNSPVTDSPITFDQTLSPSKSPETVSPTTSPSKSPITSNPTSSDPTISPSKSPVTSSPTNSPSQSPNTPSPTHQPSSESTPNLNLIADFDAAYNAPFCSTVGSSCSSGFLLDGKASNVEPNPSNTIDGCADGSTGSYHSDESVDKITISSVDGTKLKMGGLATIETNVWAWNTGSADTADFYHAADATANSITWTYLGSINAGGGSERILSRENFQLSYSPVQAVRVRFRYNGSPAPCNNGRYDDVDDLVFAVAVDQENIPAPGAANIFGSSGKLHPDKNPEPTANLMTSTDCLSLNFDRCNASPDVCYWKNQKKGCRPL